MKTRIPILIRCDGSPRIGMGHITRCLALADELRDCHHCQVTFAMRENERCAGFIRRCGYRVFFLSEGSDRVDYPCWLEGVIREVQPAALILDMRDDLPVPVLSTLWTDDMLLVTIDDLSDRRRVADLVFYPPTPLVDRIDWTGFSGSRYVGWDYCILRREFAREPDRSPKERLRMLVTTGGSDPGNITMKIIDALDDLDSDVDVTVIMGPWFRYGTEIEGCLRHKARDFEILRDVRDMHGIMEKADLAVASFGITAYELAATGVPAIHICLTEDHFVSASAFASAGMAVNLGLYTDVTTGAIIAAVRELLVDDDRRCRMACACRETVDGKGAERVARIIVERIQAL